MHEKIAIGGLSEQGVLVIGQLLAEAAFQEGHEVVYMPSYGEEKTGGAVWCDITISDEKIDDLFIARPTAAVALSPASLVKLEPAMKPRGLLVVNQSLIPSEVTRGDISVTYVPASDLATDAGDNSLANLVALGALLFHLPVVSMSSIVAAITGMHSENQERFEMKKRALNYGSTWAKERLPVCLPV